MSAEWSYEAWMRRVEEDLAAGRPPGHEGASAARGRRAGDQISLGFGSPSAASGGGRPGARRTRWSRRFTSLARSAFHHSAPDRLELLYRLAWRLAETGPVLMEMHVDPDVRRLVKLAREVRRDAHKAKAFLRFRPWPPSTNENESWSRAPAPGDGPAERYVAWHRSDHDVLPRIAEFLLDRFRDRHWLVATPQRSLWTEGKIGTGRHRFGAGIGRSPWDAEDAVTEAWCDYYRSIFNPARANEQALLAEMPRRYWSTMPEARLIPELLRGSGARTLEMLRSERHPPADGLAGAASSLEEVARCLEDCRSCRLCQGFGSAVPGEGSSTARLALVGEAPGDEEERAGRPFVGPAGRLLDECLERAGLPRRSLYLTNAVKHFRFQERGKRRIHQTPSQVEVSSCAPWVRRELELVEPGLVVCLGATAARSLIGGHVRLREHRGKVFESARRPWRLLATHHPAAILRAPSSERRRQMLHELSVDLGRAAAVAGVSYSPPEPSGGRDRPSSRTGRRAGSTP